MKAPKPAIGSGGPWDPYVPSPEAPWDLRRVVHVHRRAGFAATWDELQRDLKEGPEGSVRRLLAGRSRMEGVPAEFEAFSASLVDGSRFFSGARLGAWW